MSEIKTLLVTRTQQDIPRSEEGHSLQATSSHCLKTKKVKIKNTDKNSEALTLDDLSQYFL